MIIDRRKYQANIEQIITLSHGGWTFSVLNNTNGDVTVKVGVDDNVGLIVPANSARAITANIRKNIVHR